MKFFSKMVLLETLVMLLAVQPAIFSAHASDQQLSETAEMERIANTLSELNPSFEILGGKILNKSDGSEIYAACVEQNSQGDCLKVQYIYQQGFIKSPITDVIPMADMEAAFSVLRKDTLDQINALIQSKQGKNQSSDLLAVTHSDAAQKYYDAIYDMNGSLAWITVVGFMIVAGVAIATSFANGAILTGIVVSTATVAYHGWPVVTDLVVMPFKLAKNGLGKIKTRIKNNRVARKAKKSLKRIELALKVSVNDGNKIATLNDTDFQFLLNIFKQSMKKTATEATGEIK